MHWPVHRLICATAASALPDESKQAARRVQSASQMLSGLKERAEKKDLELYDRLKSVHSDWNKNKPDSEFLKGVPESEERELLSFINFEAEDFGSSLFDQFCRVPGLRLIERSDCIQRNPPQDCAYYVFGKTAWYKRDPLQATQKLFGPYEEAAAFLGTKGYRPTNAPRAGDLIAYSTSFFKGAHGMSHYGIVTRVDGERIEIRSKWNYGHVFEHPYQIVSLNDAEAYTFFTRAN